MRRRTTTNAGLMLHTTRGKRSYDSRRAKLNPLVRPFFNSNQEALDDDDAADDAVFVGNKSEMQCINTNRDGAPGFHERK